MSIRTGPNMIHLGMYRGRAFGLCGSMIDPNSDKSAEGQTHAKECGDVPATILRTRSRKIDRIAVTATS